MRINHVDIKPINQVIRARNIAKKTVLSPGCRLLTACHHVCMADCVSVAANRLIDCQTVTTIPSEIMSRHINQSDNRIFTSNTVKETEIPRITVNKGWGFIHRACSIDHIAMPVTSKPRMTLTHSCRLAGRNLAVIRIRCSSRFLFICPNISQCSYPSSTYVSVFLRCSASVTGTIYHRVLLPGRLLV